MGDQSPKPPEVFRLVPIPRKGGNEERTMFVALSSVLVPGAARGLLLSRALSSARATHHSW